MSSTKASPTDPTPSATLNGKLKGDVFQTDRDKFLKAFEMPTQIYRALRTHMLFSPLFLFRNLSYMRNRMKRPQRVKTGFKVDNLLAKAEARALEEKKDRNKISERFASNFLNVIVLGFTDGHTWKPDTAAAVDIQIIRISLKKRKESKNPLHKAFSANVSLKLPPPSAESVYVKDEFSMPISKGKYPAVDVPKNVFNMENGSVVQSIRLLIRVSIPVSSLKDTADEASQGANKTSASNGATRMSGSSLINSRKASLNSSSGESEEPKAKRQKSLPSKDRENFIYETQTKNSATNGRSKPECVVYVGMTTIYDKISNLSIPAEGNHNLELRLDRFDSKKNGGNGRVPARTVGRERSWETVDEQNNPRALEYLQLNGTVTCAAKLALAFRATDSKVGPMTDPPAPIYSLQNGLCKREAGEKIGREENVRVIYQFIYSNDGRQTTESHNDLRCPWCSIKCLVLYSLLKHLKLCHPRFHFNFTSISNGARVDVTINESYDGSYSGSAFDLVAQPPGQAFARNGPAKRTNVFELIVCRPPPLKRSLQEFFDSDEKDAEQRRSYLTGHNRLYHHTTTCLPIHPREIDVDSEGEPDPEWLKVKTCMMIDEFTDVNEGEKEIMKMWNHHVMHDNYVGDCQIPLACKKFVEKYGRDVINKNLYRNFILHLTNLFDFGLLPAVAFHQTVQLLHSQMKDNNTASSLRDSWRALTSTHTALAVISPISGVTNGNGSNHFESMEVDCPPLSGASSVSVRNGTDS